MNLPILTDNFEMSQPGVSRHIRILTELGLCTLEKQVGNAIAKRKSKSWTKWTYGWPNKPTKMVFTNAFSMKHLERSKHLKSLGQTWATEDIEHHHKEKRGNDAKRKENFVNGWM